jgi:hypothetical protein
MARRDALERLDGICHGDIGWDSDEQVDVIRLNLFGEHWPASFCTNRIIQYHPPFFFSYRPSLYVTPIIWTLDHMVGSSIDTITFLDKIDHTLNIYTTGRASYTRHSTVILIADFLSMDI